MIRTERTRGDARKACRIFAADAEVFDALDSVSFGWYMRFLMSVAEQQSPETDFDVEMIDAKVITKLLHYGLISQSDKFKVVVVGAEQRLNAKDKERKRRHRQKLYEREFDELVRSINRNEKPEGTPEEAIVWGGNKKRWGVKEDIQLALAVHKHVSKYNDKFQFGITLINQCRLLRMDYDVSHSNAIGLHKAISRVIKSGGKITINNMRQQLAKAGL